MLSLILPIKETINNCIRILLIGTFTQTIAEMFWQLLGPSFIGSLSRESRNLFFPLASTAWNILCWQQSRPCDLFFLAVPTGKPWIAGETPSMVLRAFPKEPRGKNVPCFCKVQPSSEANSGGDTENLIFLCSSGPLHWWPLKSSFNAMNEML